MVTEGNALGCNPSLPISFLLTLPGRRLSPVPKIEAQRSGFDFERRSNGAERTLRRRPLLAAHHGKVSACAAYRGRASAPGSM